MVYAEVWLPPGYWRDWADPDECRCDVPVGNPDAEEEEEEEVILALILALILARGEPAHMPSVQGYLVRERSRGFRRPRRHK